MSGNKRFYGTVRGVGKGTEARGTNETGIVSRVSCSEGTVEVRLRSRVGGPWVNLSFVDSEESGGRGIAELFDGPLKSVLEQGLDAVLLAAREHYSEEEWLELYRK